jgi:hypothetical protein
MRPQRAQISRNFIQSVDFGHLIATNYIRYCFVLIFLIATGCAANVSVENPTIPEPKIEKLPLDVVVRIPDEFKNFVHEENVLGREKWTIDLGSANESFFTQLFGHMFESVTVIGPDDNALDYTFDALVEPKIEGFEFSVPNQSKTDAFAVWIRYRMQIFDSVGNSAATWTVSAYGKSQKEGLGGSKSLQRAAILAMRDAAALILLQMDKATKIGTLANGPIDISQLDPGAVAQSRADAEQIAPVGAFAIGGIDDNTE